MRAHLDAKRLLIGYLVATAAQTIFILVNMDPPPSGMGWIILAGLLFYWVAPLFSLYVLLTQGTASDWWQGLLVFALVFFVHMCLYGPRTEKPALIEKKEMP